MKESQIQKNIVAFLQYKENAGKLYFIRNNVFAGQIMRRNGSIGYMRNSKPGCADIILFMPDETVFMEVKAENGRQSLDQKKFQEMIEKLGYKYAIVRSVEDVQNIVRKLEIIKIGGTN